MSSTEEEELREKINRINRHKETQHAGAPHSFDYYGGGRGAYHRSAPYPQPGFRGGRGRLAPTYRNKTLVLNGSAHGASQNDGNQEAEPTTPTWVTKTDRHLQLINRDVYERETQQRTQAIEQTQKLKQTKQDRAEKLHFLKNMQQASGAHVVTLSNSSKPVSRYEVEVDGVRFYVTQQGSKLVKVPDDLNPPAATPKVTSLFGVKFHRTKNGNLVRHGVVEAKRRAGIVKKVNETCKAFSSTGSCPKGPACRYMHDVSKVAICKSWLLKGECPKGESCDLSHEATEERTPLCVHFANGKCNNPSCQYTHAQHSPTDPVCWAFGVYGYCEKGAKCPDRHVFECPDFSNTGVCKLKGCKRPHIERASILRKANKHASSDELDDLSSDDEGAVDSDDVDSDEVEEFIGNDEEDLSFAEQKDFIGFT
ncbi:hypothetical protein F5Y17DRAFT_475366 [Xylariaceae sp. FL0594]|nr:hypothetical protein F5Y17DRAFT_475366 [Xylariaceae sp. FL0594]